MARIDPQTTKLILEGAIKLVPHLIKFFQSRTSDGKIEIRTVIEERDYDELFKHLMADGDEKIRDALIRARLSG